MTSTTELSGALVAELRALYQPDNAGALAKRFGVSKATIRRHASGEPWGDTTVPKRPARKLTTKDVRAIRADYRPGYCSLAQLAARHGVSKQAIYSVVTKRTWAHVDPEWDPPTSRYRMTIDQALDAVAHSLAKNSRRTAKGCLEWTGTVGHSGRGRIRVPDVLAYSTVGEWRIQMFAHRAAAILAHGLSPSDYVRTTCDNDLCIEPTHLYWKSQGPPPQ